jgi:hypothetical protein
MRRLIVVVALALLVPAAASGRPPVPPPVPGPGPQPVGTWAPGVEISYTETVTDPLGNVVTQVHRDGIPAGAVFGTAGIADSSPSGATSLDPGTSPAVSPTRRLAACCSPDGADTVSFEVTKRSWLGFVAWRYHQVDHWCWSYPRITCLSVAGGFYDLDTFSSVNWAANGYGWYYSWGGSPTGGHYAHEDGSVANCVIHYGCLSTSYPYVDMWLNGNGAWAASGGGN